MKNVPAPRVCQACILLPDHDKALRFKYGAAMKGLTRVHPVSHGLTAKEYAKNTGSQLGRRFLASQQENEVGNQQDALESMVTKLYGQDMPVFTATVKKITDMSIKEESSISDLALGVLKDPSLTAKVLGFANSSEYGRRLRSILSAEQSCSLDSLRLRILRFRPR